MQTIKKIQNKSLNYAFQATGRVGVCTISFKTVLPEAELIVWLLLWISFCYSLLNFLLRLWWYLWWSPLMHDQFESGSLTTGTIQVCFGRCLPWEILRRKWAFEPLRNAPNYQLKKVQLYCRLTLTLLWCFILTCNIVICLHAQGATFPR